MNEPMFFCNFCNKSLPMHQRAHDPLGSICRSCLSNVIMYNAAHAHLTKEVLLVDKQAKIRIYFQDGEKLDFVNVPQWSCENGVIIIHGPKTFIFNVSNVASMEVTDEP